MADQKQSEPALQQQPEQDREREFFSQDGIETFAQLQERMRAGRPTPE